MTITSEGLFPAEIVTDIFSAVKGKSTIAKLAPAEPIPYVGTEEWVMSMDGEAAVVEEGAQKPAGNGAVTPVIIKPFKVVYQTRVTDEFLKMSDEEKLPHMERFEDGFATKIARAVDIVGFNGVDPATRNPLWAGSSIRWQKCISQAAGDANNNPIASSAEELPAKIESVISKIQERGYDITGVAFSPAGAMAMGGITNQLGIHEFPEFRFGNVPEYFAGGICDKNSTVARGETAVTPYVVYLGDYNALRWGYCDDIAFDVIKYGDPDGLGDLKRTNEIVLRAEAYIGLGILDKYAFGGVTLG